VNPTYYYRLACVSIALVSTLATVSAQPKGETISAREPVIQGLDTLTGDKELPAGPYAPTWESIAKNYRTPEWFRDAKFGVFIHWGLYSVPGRQSEWYPRHMYGTDSMIAWHRDTYGPQDQFGYKDFIPLFTCEKFDADAWATLFKKAGIRYVMPTAEHHDGFALWDSALTKWNARAMGPHRDLIGELAVATRKQGLKFGVSNHRIEHFDFIQPKAGLATDLNDPRWADFYSVADRSEPARLRFLNDWLARNFELIDKYQPDLIYYDNGVNARTYDPLKLRVAAYYFNRANQWGKQVSFATKSQAFLAGSILDFERGHASDIRSDAWQTDNTIHHRWGYLEITLYRNAGQIVRELVDNVSKNGNLLLNIAPKADGTIPAEQVAILLDIGAWLDVNGEAIYGTRPWTRFGEGPSRLENKGNLDEEARIHREAVGDLWLPAYTAKDIRFTKKGDTLYAILMHWTSREIVITSLATGVAPAGKIEKVELLGYGKTLKFSQDSEGLKIELPATPPCDHAYAFKITGLKLN